MDGDGHEVMAIHYAGLARYQLRTSACVANNGHESGYKEAEEVEELLRKKLERW